MVVDKAYYDLLGVEPGATDIEIKKGYRKAAIIHHPDKNPDDPSASAKFQEIGEAYQVLSDPQLRAAYDKYGKESARPSEGFVDPAEFFTSIFGGDAFIDWIGEISIMKDLTAAMEIAMQGELEEGEEGEFPGTEEAMKESAKEAGTAPPTVVVEDEKVDPSAAPAAAPAAAAEASSAGAARTPSPAGSASRTSTPRPTAIPIRPALMDKPSDEVTATEGSSDDLAKKKKDKDKSGLSKEQRDQLAALRKEQDRARKERIDTLTVKLLDRVSVWTETDKGPDVTAAFKEKMRLEVEEMKMESFGLNICHAIGQTYISRGSTMIKSQKFLGITGFFSRLKEKGVMIKDTWNTISSALDAQAEMKKAALLEEEAGEDWTDERKAEQERRLTGKILTAAWRGSKFEIQDILRGVCDNVLNDETVPLTKRLERAHALVVIGEVFVKARRSPEEDGDYLVFEKLVAEAAMKDKEKHKHKSKSKDKEKDKEDEKHKVAADAPNVHKAP